MKKKIEDRAGKLGKKDGGGVGGIIKRTTRE